MKNYYSILGVDRAATSEDIKRAYRRLASQHHPDKGGDKSQFQEIQEAYAVLGDPAQRQAYDNPQSGVHARSGAFDFDTIFSMFGTRFGDTTHHTASTVRMQLWVGLRDIAQGGRRPVSLSGPWGRSTVEIEIPQGVDDGASVRYPNIAPQGGDLVAVFRVRSEPGWQRQGQDVIYDYSVSIWDLVLGRDITVPTLTDKSVAVTIPPGTQPGTMLRLRGQGLRTFRQAAPGDMLVRLQARLPATISPELMDAIKRENHQ